MHFFSHPQAFLQFASCVLALSFVEGEEKDELY